MVTERSSMGARTRDGPGNDCPWQLDPILGGKPVRAVALGKRQDWRWYFDLCYGMVGKEKCDCDNTEALDPASFESRCVPMGPVDSLYCKFFSVMTISCD